jgi:hypothetical protein
MSGRAGRREKGEGDDGPRECLKEDDEKESTMTRTDHSGDGPSDDSALT